MNKCNFCKCSTPTGQMGSWKCDYANDSSQRELWCKGALKTMMEFNQVRAYGNKSAVEMSKCK